MSKFKVGDVVSIMLAATDHRPEIAMIGDVVHAGVGESSVLVEGYYVSAMGRYWLGSSSLSMVWCAP